MFLGTKFRTLRLETSALMRSEEKRAVPFTDKKKVAAVFLRSLSSGPPWSPGPQSMTGLQFQKVRFP